MSSNDEHFPPANTFNLDPARLLAIEIVSPESRRRDLGEKAEAYFAVGALAYWTVEIPILTGVSRPKPPRANETRTAGGPKDRWSVSSRRTLLDLRINLDDLAI